LNIILLLFLLQAFCLAAGFGVAYSLLRRTPYSHLCVLVAPIVYPVCLVVLLTLGGHKVLQYLPPMLPAILTIPFLLYSAFVVWQHRAALASARYNFRTPLCVLAASTILALPSLAPDIVHQSLSYTDTVVNNELLNYAALASYLMGRTIHGAYAAVYQQIVAIRSGADLLLASLANGLNTPPANCISLFIALFRAQAITAFGFLILRGTQLAIAKRPWLLYSGIALFSLSSLELVNYSMSFVSHYQVAPIVILLASFLLFQQDAYDSRVLGLMTLLYLYLYISYPEIVVIPLFIQIIQALLLSYQARSARLPLFALSPPVIAAVVNPMLTIKRLHWILYQSRGQNGFAMFASPRDSIIAYCGSLLGLRSLYLGVKVFDDIRAEAVVALFLLMCLVAALWFTVRYQRQYWAVAGAMILIGATVTAWSTNPVTSGIGVLYKSEKVLIYGNFMLMAAFVFAVFGRHNKKLLHAFITTGYVLLLLTSFRLSAEVASRFGSWAKTYTMTDVAAAVKTTDRNAPVWLPGGDADATMYWNESLQYFGVADRHAEITTHRQASALFDYSNAEAGLFVPVAPGQKGTFIVSTLVNVPDPAGWYTAPLSPMVNSATLLYRGRSFAVYSGPLQRTDFMVFTCDVVFPPAPSGLDPLLTGGIAGNGFFIYVQYPAKNIAQISYALWGTPAVVGEPFQIQPGRAERLRIVLDSQHETTDVFVDDKAVLHRAGLIQPLHLMSLTIGQNQLGGLPTNPRFTGEIRNLSTGEPSMEGDRAR
jgi:hypothetical protein